MGATNRSFSNKESLCRGYILTPYLKINHFISENAKHHEKVVCLSSRPLNSDKESRQCTFNEASFSTVSKPMFPSNYSICSVLRTIFRDLQESRTIAKSNVSQKLMIFWATIDNNCQKQLLPNSINVCHILATKLKNMTHLTVTFVNRHFVNTYTKND